MTLAVFEEDVEVTSELVRDKAISPRGAVCKSFINPADCELTPPPCCAQSEGYGSLEYLRVFWFSLLQECAACVTHRQPETWSMSSQYLQITTRLHSFEDEKRKNSCFSFVCV